MTRFLVRRLLLALPVILGVSTLVFFFIHMIPGDPVEIMLGERAQAVDKDALRRDLGLDRPLAAQYVRFLTGLAHGDAGTSLYYRAPVLTTILDRYPATLELTGAAMVLSLCIALPLGLLSARRPSSLSDRVSLGYALVGASIPNFWLGLLLILLFAIRLDMFPVSGRDGPASLVLPALTLAIGMSALLSRMISSGVRDSLGKVYITAARARGAGEVRVLLVHALRNAVIPLITILGLQFGALLSGAIITETIFSWPGVGRLLIQAIDARDYPLVQGCVLAIAFGYIAVNILVDIAYALADPRVRDGW